MKIRVISDIHLNTYFPLIGDMFSDASIDNFVGLFVGQENSIINPLESDKDSILVVAGDIFEVTGVYDKNRYDIRVLKKLFTRFSEVFSRVIVVMGNHDHYHMEFSEAPNIWKQIVSLDFNIPNLHLLNNETVKIDDVTFYGTTLWTDFMDMHPSSIDASKRYMRHEYSVIKDISHQKIYDEHKKAVHWLNSSLAVDNGKKVVVTHHLPSFSAISPRFMMHPVSRLINGAFASNLDELIQDHKPDLWIFGHTHDDKNYHLFDTKMVCNPLGYLGETNNYKNDLIVEI